MARLVDLAFRQFQGPQPVNGQPIRGQQDYHFAPITEQNVHEHIQQNPAADSRHHAPEAEPAQPKVDDESDDGPVSVLW